MRCDSGRVSLARRRLRPDRDLKRRDLQSVQGNLAVEEAQPMPGALSPFVQGASERPIERVVGDRCFRGGSAVSIRAFAGRPHSDCELGARRPSVPPPGSRRRQCSWVDYGGKWTVTSTLSGWAVPVAPAHRHSDSRVRRPCSASISSLRPRTPSVIRRAGSGGWSGSGFRGTEVGDDGDLAVGSV